MLRFVLLLIIIVLLVHWFQRIVEQWLAPPAAPPPRKSPDTAPDAFEGLVACVACGVRIPVSRAIPTRQGPCCSAACRERMVEASRRGPRQAAGGG